MLLIMVAALFVVSCTTTTYGNGNGTGSTLVGTTWTGTDSFGAIITITFTDAVNGTGNVIYNGAPFATLKFTYSMKDVSNGSGAIIETTTAGKTEVYSFSFIYINNELFVTAPDYFDGTIKFTRSGGQGGGGGSVTPGGDTPGSSLVGTTWRWTEDEPDEYTQIKFETASTGSGFSYDEGEVYDSFNFTYTMSSATAGSGTLYRTDYYGQTQFVPFTFTVIGNDLYFTATIGSEKAAFTFKKVS